MTPVTSLLTKRFSARAYTGEPISREALQSLLEAARWAPSSVNEQPWSFIVAPRQEEAAFAALLGCLNEGNQVWAKNAAVLMVCATATHFVRHDRPNRHAWHDVGLAVMAMAVQSVSLGLQQREMGGIDADKARALYQVPATHEITSALAIGVPGEVSEYLAKRERKALPSFVFQGAWGRPFDFGA
jgi:nitroreductase